ncbi:lytic transglycosylase domain-containing protein [Desulforamulus hydrothermalis]|uniref:Lytic transglycosylase catalytic n=1 Tax=Desulforamulus hydrothermalis Lam5 = DSM 18033 TaxID=1121428 RepID=K8DXK2_9FIRM|nr:lytic transglycosylase domain-containing protein [Desulforamulus hydrothermalis]CCO07285.1 Lytic transglycosylase catalytic [Desulforamulus hydrothermalis Lam5 = DSM 18033]SHG93175.1 soluble lytic murein transglycosylase [Desulforamulus hydrothermalis Lam5 = DSM 18033]
MSFHHKPKRNVKINLLLLLALLLLWFNHRDIGRRWYPLQHQEVIYHYAAANKLDPLLVAAVIKTESNFNARATSPKGARGLMQIMPDTANWISQQIGGGPVAPDKLYNPEINISLGTWYLADLLDEFNGDLVLATAAYNAGRGNVRSWLNEQHWTGEHKTIDQIPFWETRQYIRRVLWNYKVYNYLYGGGNKPLYNTQSPSHRTGIGFAFAIT